MSANLHNRRGKTQAAPKLILSCHYKISVETSHIKNTNTKVHDQDKKPNQKQKQTKLPEP